MLPGTRSSGDRLRLAYCLRQLNYALFFPAPDIRRVASAAELGDLAAFQQLCQCPLDGDLADIWAFGHDLALGDLAEVVLDDLPHPVGLGKSLGGQQLDPAFKIPVRRRQNAQHIGDKGGIVIGPLMPVVRTLLQGLVIGFFGVGNQLFDADIFAHDIARAVQEQQCQEPAHAAITVIEGVDAEKVQNENWNQQQRIKLRVLHGRPEGVAQRRDSPRRFPRGDGPEADDLLTVRQFFGNHVVRIFEAAADGLAAELIQIPMKLQNNRRLRRNIIVAFVNGRQHITITGNLLFAASLGHGFLPDNFPQPIIRGDDALDAVGCLGALDSRNLRKIGQRIHFGLDEEILLSLVFVNLRQVGHDLRRQELVVFCFEVERSHAMPSFEFQFHQISLNDTIIVYP